MTEVQPRPILVADDEPDDEFLIRHRLSKSQTSHPIVSFTDGADLVEYLEDLIRKGGDIPRLLFLDLKMPRMDGFDSLTWIRSRNDLDPLTVIVVTSSSRPEDIERARSCGARQVMTKFPSAEDLALSVSAFA